MALEGLRRTLMNSKYSHKTPFLTRERRLPRPKLSRRLPVHVVGTAITILVTALLDAYAALPAVTEFTAITVSSS